jgi:hypothetical protein
MARAQSTSGPLAPFLPQEEHAFRAEQEVEKAGALI